MDSSPGHMWKLFTHVRLIAHTGSDQLSQNLTTALAKALYSYVGANADELSFAEGEDLTIVDMSEQDWWKAERGGVVFIVPAAYLKVHG